MMSKNVNNKLIGYAALPVQIAAIFVSVYWMYITAIDAVMHQNVHILMLSMGYVCFATPVIGIMIAFIDFSDDVEYYLTLCLMVASLQQTFHGVIFLIERCVATKWSSTYENKNAIFSVIIYMTLTWSLCVGAIICVDMGLVSMLNYTVFLCALGAFLAVCAIILFKFNVNEYNKPIRGLSERYQNAKNICICRSFFICTVIQFVGNAMITFCMVMNTFVFTPQKLGNAFIVSTLVLNWSVLLMSFSIPMNFIMWKRKEQRGTLRFCSNSIHSTTMYRGVTGKVVPLTAEADEYFKQLKKNWT